MPVLLTLIAIVAYAIVWRSLWTSPGRLSGTVPRLAALVLAVTLSLLAATGRLPWAAALLIGALPFTRLLLSPQRGSSQGSESTGGASSDGQMSDSEALAILGLEAGADDRAVIDAHRRLMQKLHPDRGGTTFLAQQLNEAKRTLLKRTQR